MATGRRELEIRYERPESFRADYDTNLSNGGAFVPTDAELALRESVVVRLALDFAPEAALALEGEVVHVVTASMAALGGRAGVAVQFREPVAAIRERMAPLLASLGALAPPRADPTDARAAPRTPARLATRIETPEGTLAGRTRDLSRSGALVGVQQGSVSIGDVVRIALRHPTTQALLEVEGRVVRDVASGERISAVAVQFAPEPEEQERVERFLEDAQSVEHARQLGGIHGAIAELGVQGLVQMFAGAASAGTLVLRSGAEEATLGFRENRLCVARLGPASGMKALVRLLGWTEGSFAFHARLDDDESSDEPLPLDAALAEAIRLVEEGCFIDADRFPPQAHLAALPAADPGELDKLEAAVLDLARAGSTVQRALDVIPEPDPEIYRALAALIDADLLALR